MPCRLSPLAERDLDEIWSYVAEDATPTPDRPGSSWTTRSDRGLVGVTLTSQASPNRRRKSGRSGWKVEDLRSAVRAKSLRSASNRSRPFAVLAA